MRPETTTCYRPAGAEELALVERSGWTRWPPRLPEQPFFYPVTNEKYAREIAMKWNTRENRAGYVTRFEVKSDYMRKYDVHRVGAPHHTEWWIPADELEELNNNILGKIEVVAEFRSKE